MPNAMKEKKKYYAKAGHSSSNPFPILKHIAVLSRARGAAAALAALAREAAAGDGAIPRADDDLLSDLHDPRALQQLGRTRAAAGILLKASPQELDALGTELIPAGQLRWVPLGDVVHDRPLVVQARPRAAAGCHLEDHAPERPDVDGALAAFVGAFDDLGGHVHGRAGHGFLFARKASGGVGEVMVVGLKGLVLARDDFGSAKVNVLDHAVVVEKNIWGSKSLAGYKGRYGKGRWCTYFQA